METRDHRSPRGAPLRRDRTRISSRGYGVCAPGLPQNKSGATTDDYCGPGHQDKARAPPSPLGYGVRLSIPAALRRQVIEGEAMDEVGL